MGTRSPPATAVRLAAAAAAAGEAVAGARRRAEHLAERWWCSGAQFRPGTTAAVMAATSASTSAGGMPAEDHTQRSASSAATSSSNLHPFPPPVSGLCRNFAYDTCRKNTCQITCDTGDMNNSQYTNFYASWNRKGARLILIKEVEQGILYWANIKGANAA